MPLGRKYHQYKLILADFLAAAMAWAVFYTTRKPVQLETSELITGSLLLRSFVVASFWSILYLLRGRYKDVFRLSRLKETVQIGAASMLGGIAIFFSLLLDDQGVYWYELYFRALLSYSLLHFSITSFLNLVVLTHYKQLIKKGKIFYPTILVGSLNNARELYEEIVQNNRRLGLKIQGFVQGDAVEEHAFETAIPCLGNYQELSTVIQKHQIEEVIIAIEPSEHRLIEHILGYLEDESVRISILPDLYQILLGSVRVSHIFGTPLIEVKRDLLPIWKGVLKRLFDVVVSLFVLVLFFPFYLLIAILVKLSSPGPVIFAQDRIGLHAKPFKIFKFRSMYTDAEATGPALSSDKDPRITPLGRFLRKMRIDELPQFYNVLIGDMSLVGPRPERQYYIDLIMQEAPHYRHLHRVRPGITSLGQVKFGYAENVPQMIRRLKYDILYIENMSLGMDIRVLVYTIKTIVQGRGK